jgi:hypothetical protein
MYVHQRPSTWLERAIGSARTLTAIVLTAVLASLLTVHWSDAAATGDPDAAFSFQNGLTTIPVSLEGTIVGAGDDLVAVLERGAVSPVAFAVDGAAPLLRAGQPIALEDLRNGDVVHLTIDGLTGSVLRLHATPASSGLAIRISDSVALLAAIGLIGAGTLLAIRNSDRLPRLPYRVAAARLAPAAAHR